MTVKSCGDDNKANQMGLTNSCRKVGTGKDKGLGCVCDETECYCYCTIESCTCNGSSDWKTFYAIKSFFSIVPSILMSYKFLCHDLKIIKYTLY